MLHPTVVIFLVCFLPTHFHTRTEPDRPNQSCMYPPPPPPPPPPASPPPPTTPFFFSPPPPPPVPPVGVPRTSKSQRRTSYYYVLYKGKNHMPGLNHLQVQVSPCLGLPMVVLVNRSWRLSFLVRDSLLKRLSVLLQTKVAGLHSETHNIMLYHDKLAAVLARQNLLPGIARLCPPLLVARDGAEWHISTACPTVVAIVLFPPASGRTGLRLLARSVGDQDLEGRKTANNDGLEMVSDFGNQRRRWQTLTDGGSQSRPDHEHGQVDKLLLDQHLLGTDDGKSNHDKTESKHTDQANLLLQGYLDVIDQPEWHGHDCGRCCQWSYSETGEYRRRNLLQRSVKTSRAVL